MAVGWVILLAALFVAGLALLLRLRPRLLVGPRGLLDRASGLGWIPWDEIEGAYRLAGGRSDSVRLRVRVTERLSRVLRRRRPELSPAAGLPETIDVDLELAGSQVTATELLRRILHGAG